jgi:hypothetical protein
MNRTQPHNILREGLVAGTIGATVVAVWFLVLDMIQGRPFHTPAVLGAALFSLLGPALTETDTARIAGYTVFHYVIFGLLGTLLVYIVHRSHREPNILAGLLVVFVSFEVGFYGFAALLSEPGLFGELGWYQIMLGNLLASLAMGTYLWRMHPVLGTDFAHALNGDDL